MLGNTLLKLVGLLSPDDVKELKAAGCESEVMTLLASFDGIAVAWRKAGFDSRVWADIQIKLNALRFALRG